MNDRASEIQEMMLNRCTNNKDFVRKSPEIGKQF